MRLRARATSCKQRITSSSNKIVVERHAHGRPFAEDDGLVVGKADGIAIETVNVSRIAVEVLRVPDRILSQYSVDQSGQNEEGGWEFDEDGKPAKETSEDGKCPRTF